LLEFAAGLVESGWTLLASGGTARLLRQNGLPVTEVAEYTGSPEILEGRVKTLHPAIHGGLLARPTRVDHEELQRLGWDYIDLAVVNLYPFEQTIGRAGVSLAEVIENIDIGGVTLIRAAAKNFERVTLACDPADYAIILAGIKKGGVSQELRQRLALKGFTHTAHYDAVIAGYFAQQAEGAEMNPLSITLYPIQSLRYGENPHQAAVLYGYQPGMMPLGGRVLQGKELSYTNLLDLDGAWRAVVSFDKPGICIVKHVSPCGLAVASSLADAFKAALASDPVSAYGGVIASNTPVDAATVDAMGSLFIECLIAPGFTEEARQLLAKRKNCRLVEMPDTRVEPDYELRSVTRGVLRQQIDFGDPAGTEWKVVSKRQPTPAELSALHFALKACQHVRSNAIVLAVDEATVGIGGGQPNRVDSTRIAINRAGERARGAVMASDAFFPFSDSVQAAAEAGVTAVVHPGGSMRDQDSINVCDRFDMAMVVTGARHFRH
jgi:phosphoribosylaminoimidazolecarboxamide formyltransferase/IMP cyclohydrolase